MEKSKKIGFLQLNNEVFSNSIKRIDLNIILIVVLDALFYFALNFILVFWQNAVELKRSSINVPAPEELAILGYGKTQEILSQGKSFLFFMIFSTILVIITIIFLTSVFKGIIWARTAKTNLSLNFLSKFLVLNLIWMGFWFLILILISLLVDPYFVALYSAIAILVGLFFAGTIYTIFMKKQNLKSITAGIRLNIAKIHLMLLPYGLIFLVLYIILKISGIFNFQYSAIVLYAVLIAYSALIRYYISELVLRIEHR